MIIFNSIYQLLKITLFLEINSKVINFLYELIYAIKDDGLENTINMY